METHTLGAKQQLPQVHLRAPFTSTTEVSFEGVLNEYKAKIKLALGFEFLPFGTIYENVD